LASESGSGLRALRTRGCQPLAPGRGRFVFIGLLALAGAVLAQ